MLEKKSRGKAESAGTFESESRKWKGREPVILNPEAFFFQHPFIRKSKPTGVLADLIDRAKSKIAEVGGDRRKLLQDDKDESSGSSEENSENEDDEDEDDDDDKEEDSEEEDENESDVSKKKKLS